MRARQRHRRACCGFRCSSACSCSSSLLLLLARLLAAVAAHCLRVRQYVDMIWLAGDVTRLCEEDYEVPARFSASEGDMSAVLSALENIQCRVAYVPGAHDPSSTTV